MEHTQYTISDCYTGSIERLFNADFLQFALYFHERFQPELKGILEAKSLRSEFRPTWTSIIMNYEHIIHENLAVVAIRGAATLEYNFCFDGRPICAGLLDLLVPMYFMQNKSHEIAVYFSDCDLEIEKSFWLKVIQELSSMLKLDAKQIKTHFLSENKKSPNKKLNDSKLPLPIFSSHSDLTNFWDRVI